MNTEAAPVLKVDGLTISAGGRRTIVEDASFSLGPGEIGALVGQSGSGKTSIAKAILRLLAPPLQIDRGAILFDGHDLASADIATLRGLRGRRMGAVFQEPMTSLNPSLTVGAQMMEALRLHRTVSRRQAKDLCLEMLRRVKIHDPERCFEELPGKFSGGMRQRFALASVLLTRPSLLIADEPTTALDALIRKDIMEQMVELAREIGTSVLLVSHDLAMVSQYADSATVLDQGRVVEQGGARQILLHPRTPYMRDFVRALPRRPDSIRSPSSGRSLVDFRSVEVAYPIRRAHPFARKRSFAALRGIDLSVRQREILAVVGESGSGKTTVAQTLLGLCRPSAGSVSVETGSNDPAGSVQMVFQDSLSSLDPQMTLERIVAEPLLRIRTMSEVERLTEARAMLREVGLPEESFTRHAHELSGGQRQRVSIARAMVSRPALVVADEPVSALDVSIQRQVVDLMMRLREQLSLSYLFISHDLSVVEEIADRVMVMYKGRIVESGPRPAVFDTPHHPYTRRLLQATPRIIARGEDRYELVQARDDFIPPPAGFDYHENGDGLMVDVGSEHQVLCTPL